MGEDQKRDDEMLAIGWLRRRVKALEGLNTCYRVGSHPSEKLLTELDATRDGVATALAALEDQDESGEG